MALILFRPAVILVALALLAYLLWLQRRVHLRWRPAWVLRAILVLAALVGVFFPRGELLPYQPVRREILILDQSASIPDGTRVMWAENARAWQAARLNRMVVVFGTAPAAVIDPGKAWPVVSETSTNLKDALALASGMLGNPPQGRIILASDGLATNSVATNSAAVDVVVAQLAAQSVPVDVIPLSPRSDPSDIFTGPLQVPEMLWENTPLNVVVTIHNAASAPPGQLTLRLLLNGEQQSISPQPLGQDAYLFQVAALPRGIVELAVQADLPGDPVLENNISYAVLRVYPSPAALLVTSQPEDRFSSVLKQSGLVVDSTSPAELGPEDMDPRRYQAILLNNILASQLTNEQMSKLRAFAAEQGGAVIFLGGQNSYTLGGYNNTIIEPMLPVALAAPERSQKPPVVFLLVLDKSDSMDYPNGLQLRPLTLAKEAAIRTVEMLDQRDMLGVLVFSTDSTWPIPLRMLGDGIVLREALDSISAISANGGTLIYRALGEAVTEINANAPQDIPQRHILLLTDGDSWDGTMEEFIALAEQAHNQGITVSTIRLGEKSDGRLEAIAEYGGGRYFEVKDASDLPRIMMNESRAARSENIQTGLTTLKPGEEGHPVLAGLTGEGLPATDGYNALRSRREEGAEDILVSSSFEDPILSVWQFGLGRVAAWTSDLGQMWSKPWPNAHDEAYFWSQILRYTLPDPGVYQANVAVTTDSLYTTVEAEIRGDANQPLNLLPVNFTFTTAAGTARNIALDQAAPGFYRVQLDRFEPGTYRALISYRGGDGLPVEVLTPFSVNAPPELQPVDETARAEGVQNLQRWMLATGGSELTTFGENEVVQAQEQNEAFNLTAQWYLILALVISWPVEIALRRRWLPWGSSANHL